MVHCVYLGATGYNLKKTQTNIIFLSLKIDFVFPNSTDYDDIPHYVVYHQGLLLLDKVHVKSPLVFKGLNGLLTMSLYTSVLNKKNVLLF